MLILNKKFFLLLKYVSILQKKSKTNYFIIVLSIKIKLKQHKFLDIKRKQDFTIGFKSHSSSRTDRRL